MRKIIALITAVGIMVLCLGQPAFSQTDLSNPAPQKTGKILGLLPLSGFSLLDPNRIHISNSYSFSYVSAGQYSGSFGLFQTSIGYQVSNPLYLQVDLGVLHQPFGLKNNLDINSRVFPNFYLLYNPGNNFSFSINVLTGPSNSYHNYWYQGGR